MQLMQRLQQSGQQSTQQTPGVGQVGLFGQSAGQGGRGVAGLNAVEHNVQSVHAPQMRMSHLHASQIRTSQMPQAERVARVGREETTGGRIGSGLGDRGQGRATEGHVSDTVPGLALGAALSVRGSGCGVGECISGSRVAAGETSPQVPRVVLRMAYPTASPCESGSHGSGGVKHGKVRRSSKSHVSAGGGAEFPHNEAASQSDAADSRLETRRKVPRVKLKLRYPPGHGRPSTR